MDILQKSFSSFIEAENTSQNTGCSNFVTTVEIPVSICESKVPSGSLSANLVLLDKIYTSKSTPRSLNTEYISSKISPARVFVSWYRLSFGSYKCNYFSSCCLDLWGFPYEGLSIDPIWKIYTLFFPTLYGSASIPRSK